MGTLATQILVGKPHPDDDGLIPSHGLFLSENNRPAWVMFQQDILRNTLQPGPVFWIPILENMLEDAFLMIAIHI